MSAQILLQGRLLGADDFLLSAPADKDNRALEARLWWVALLGEVLPRALLAELQLSPLMLGSSGGGRFLVILPDNERAAAAADFLTRASATLQQVTRDVIRIAWSATENLGDWTVVRKRLHDGMRAALKAQTPDATFFAPFSPAAASSDQRAPDQPADAAIPRNLRDAATVGWNFDLPTLIAPEGGRFRWDLGRQASLENIALTRHAARNGDAPASMKELAKRAKGEKLWGMLRGEIDDFGTRIRRAQSVEEHVQLSVLYKQFLAGEIELLCSQGDYFQRVTVLRADAADFVVCGSWDALAGFARELQRVFAIFAEENLKELPGAEAKTMTMAITLADSATPTGRAWQDSVRDLEFAKASDKDCLYILGEVLEWKQLNDAVELKDTVIQLNGEFRGGRQFLGQLRSLYKKAETTAAPGGVGAGSGEQERLMARAIRFQRRFARVANRKEREFQKLRSHLMKEMAGRSARGRLRLRPEGLVALEWARLAED